MPTTGLLTQHPGEVRVVEVGVLVGQAFPLDLGPDHEGVHGAPDALLLLALVVPALLVVVHRVVVDRVVVDRVVVVLALVDGVVVALVGLMHQVDLVHHHHPPVRGHGLVGPTAAAVVPVSHGHGRRRGIGRRGTRGRRRRRRPARETAGSGASGRQQLHGGGRRRRRGLEGAHEPVVGAEIRALLLMLPVGVELRLLLLSVVVGLELAGLVVHRIYRGQGHGPANATVASPPTGHQKGRRRGHGPDGLSTAGAAGGPAGPPRGHEARRRQRRST